MKKLMIVSVVFLLILSWYGTLTDVVKKPMEYRKHLEAAKKNEEKEIYYDAVLEYQKALTYGGDQREIQMEIAKAYQKLGDETSYIQTLNDVIDLGGDAEEPILMLADYYLNHGQKEDAIALLKKQIQEQETDGALRTKLNSLAGGFQKTGEEYDDISNSFQGYMLVSTGEEKGMIDSEGNSVIRTQYEALGAFGENGFAPAKKNGEWYYIDTNNYKRREPDETYQFLGILSQGVLPAEKNGQWGYLDQEFQEKTKFVYEDATPLLDGLGAVKKDGKWALIDETLKPVTEFGFDDIVRDEWGFCSRNGRVFVKVGETYRMIGADGVQIGGEYEAVSPFLSEKPAAVRKGGKWGFISKEGETVLESAFENAGSFSEIGYAAVYSGGKWGYIKENGDFVMEPQFDDAKGFNEKGIAPVKEQEKWRLIRLDIYE